MWVFPLGRGKNCGGQYFNFNSSFGCLNFSIIQFSITGFVAFPFFISEVFVSGGFSNIDGFTDEEKKFWLTITPEIVEES